MDWAAEFSKNGPLIAGFVAVVAWLLRDRSLLISELKGAQAETKAAQQRLEELHEQRTREQREIAVELRDVATTSMRVVSEFNVRAEALLRRRSSRPPDSGRVA